MTSTFTPNKSYNQQGTGDNPNAWGGVLNGVLSVIDNNLGEQLVISVAGNSNVTPSATQAQCVFHKLTGTLTGSISYILPGGAGAGGGFYLIDNETSGAFTVTVTTVSGTGVIIPQGSRRWVFSDGTNFYFCESQPWGATEGGTGITTAPTNGQLVIGNSTTHGFNLATLTAGSGITITNGPGTVTLSSSAGSGSVTSITAGTGLTGGTITTSGTIAVSYGTTSGTAAQGNDSRITGALQAASNLSDLNNAGTARTSLGLGTAAVKASSGSGGTLASVSGSFTSGHMAVFADTAGTIKDGGAAPSTTGTLNTGTTNTMNPFAVGTVSTQAHGLGAAPFMVTSWLQCITTNLGYAAGDRVYGGNPGTGYVIQADGTNTTIITESTLPSLPSKTGDAAAPITAADWKIIAIPYTLN